MLQITAQEALTCTEYIDHEGKCGNQGERRNASHKKRQYPVRYIEHMKGGQGHMITNTGKTSLKYLAVIIYGMSMQFHKMQ